VKKKGKDPLELVVHAHCKSHLLYISVCFVHGESKSPSSADQVLINPVCNQFVHVSEPR